MDKVFNFGNVFIVETVAKDSMHPSRTVNTIYAVDATTGRETFLSQRGFAHGPTLDVQAAYNYAKKFL